MYKWNGGDPDDHETQEMFDQIKGVVRHGCIIVFVLAAGLAVGLFIEQILQLLAQLLGLLAP